ncbi:MAG: hypothetical protein QOC71_1434 [Thermoplasmata archaeon]|jgi:mRNA-degrading endonuclease RelE of RelBE toxin-antitoxin system|nr:hypothetical protein [Thermoplasmata archaeon]
MAWSIRFAGAAEREFERLPHHAQARFARAFSPLVVDPGHDLVFIRFGHRSTVYR